MAHHLKCLSEFGQLSTVVLNIVDHFIFVMSHSNYYISSNCCL